MTDRSRNYRDRSRSNDRYNTDSKRKRTRSPVHENHYDNNRNNRSVRSRSRSRERYRNYERSGSTINNNNNNKHDVDKSRKDSHSHREKDFVKDNEKSLDCKTKENIMRTLTSTLNVKPKVNYNDNDIERSKLRVKIDSEINVSKENVDIKKNSQKIDIKATILNNEILATKQSNNIPIVVNDIQYDENELKEIESFLDHTEEDSYVLVDEEEKEQLLIEERRRKRLEISSKYNTHENSKSKVQCNRNDSTFVQNIPEDDFDPTTNNNINSNNNNSWVTRKEIEVSLSSVSTVPNTSKILAKLNITDNDIEVDIEQQQQQQHQMTPILHLLDDVEGRQLAVEKSALEAEENLLYGTGKYTFDMFSASPSGFNNIKQVTGRRALREALLEGEGENPHLQSNWDDGEGYYKARIGELIGDRFQTLGVVGKGVFSTVLKCIDLRLGDGTQHVAIKMIRNNDTMRRAAEKEKSILLSIAEHDPNNKKFCVRLLTHLEFRNHVALVFEYQQMNLREALKKFGKDVGINIGAIRMYGRQLFFALKHLMDLQVVHADIKLDNILCSADLKQVKLCDFGSAFRETDTDNDPTPYLVSRFYRAPEIILGLACKC